MHPKHFVELDPLSRHTKDSGEFWQATIDEHNKANWSKGIRGTPLSIMVKCDDDVVAAGEVMTRIIRVWNLLRDISDEDLGDVVVLKRSSVEDICNDVKKGIADVLEKVVAWEPGELADER